MWNLAAKAGLALGLISTVYMFINQFLGTSGISAFLISLCNIILWTAKFIGCIWLMKSCMKRFVADNTEADNSQTFKLGIIMAFLSSVVFAAASFANTAFISADVFAEQIELMMQQMAPMMDSNTLDATEKMLGHMPEITFFSNLSYCFIYGTVLSLILSRNIPDKNPFAGYTPDQQ